MESISPAELAVELLNHCLRGQSWPEEVLDALVDDALDEDERLAAPATQALFGILVERLADLFEPRLCDVYASLFARVIERASGLPARGLTERYRRVRAVRRVEKTPSAIYVLSRVTLGADVAITSIVLDGARRRFPGVPLYLVGPTKAYELFEKSPDVLHVAVSYGRRGLLADRLAICGELSAALSTPGALVLDPDSRLTQLGLLPVCPEDTHHLFESRGYGGDSHLTLPELARRWVRETLEVDDAEPWLHPKFQYDFGSARVATVSLGVGENPAKRIADPFEERLLRLLAEHFPVVMVDAGAPGSEEERRVRAAIERAAVPEGHIGLHEGSFASFAAMIAASSFYAGYDSAGQHVAAALDVELVSLFAGAASPRMLERWRPASPRATVIEADRRPADAVLDAVRAVLCAHG